MIGWAIENTAEDRKRANWKENGCLGYIQDWEPRRREHREKRRNREEDDGRRGKASVASIFLSAHRMCGYGSALRLGYYWLRIPCGTRDTSRTGRPRQPCPLGVGSAPRLRVRLDVTPALPRGVPPVHPQPRRRRWTLPLLLWRPWT